MVTAHWPLGALDPDELRETGWRPAPFREFVFKLHGKCNLACDYCYLYTMGDEGWRSRPAMMSISVLTRAGQRVAEHAEKHGLGSVKIILHGGEPLLVGPDKLGQAVRALRSRLPRQVTAAAGIQTNGVLLDAGLLRVLSDLDVRVAVSLDGQAAVHDRHRGFAHGGGSHAAVMRALTLLASPQFRHLFSGLLCTIDITADPIETYEALAAFEPPAIDLLLPHGSWSSPPPFRGPDPSHAPYADWLIACFDRWYDAPRMETDIRLFSEIIHMILGGRSRTESVGLSPVAAIVIETDGSMEQVDTLRAAFPGAAATALDVFLHSFDEALEHPAIIARQIGLRALCEQCLGCAVRDICGAGHFPHRYQAGQGFLNPSVYCPDLMRLIKHIRHRLSARLAGLREPAS